MANKSPLLNVIFQALNKVTRKLLRDFGEVENLQLSPNSIVDFVTKAEKQIDISLIEDLSKARPDWLFKSSQSNDETKTDQYLLDNRHNKWKNKLYSWVTKLCNFYCS